MVISTVDMDGPFNGVVELADRMAGSSQVHQCVVTQLFRYAAGRGETQADACTIQRLYDSYVGERHSFRSLVRSLATHEAFRMRREAEEP